MPLDLAAFSFTDERKDLNALAQVAEAAERYDDMCAFMRALVQKAKDDLTVGERNLLSVAYKNNIGARRASWRTLNADDSKDDPKITAYRKQVENELETMCQEVLELLEKHLVPKVKAAREEAAVFYLKMTGDYYRYLAEFVNSKGYDKSASDNYSEAMAIAKEKLPPTHPIRLGLALNFSVCQYEILKKPKEACDMAKSAFDDAIAKLDQLDESSYKDSTLIMQLLRDNLTLWTSENEEAEEDA